jgi:hypothetical protein
MAKRTSSVGYFLIIISVCCGYFGFFYSAHAETLPQNSVIVRPAKAEVTLSAGEERRVTFTVSNGTGEPLRARVSFEDIAANEQGSAIDDSVRLLGEAMGVHSLKDTLLVTQSSFELQTGMEISVPVTIRIPKGVEPGGRYGSVVFHFSKLADAENPEANISLEGRIATLLYVRISGDVLEEGKLAAFGLFNNAKTTKSPTILDPLRMQVAYQNTGSVHLNPYGRITVRSIFGNTHILTIDPWAVLPGATRMREIDMTEALIPGFYTAHLELNRGYKDIVDEQTVTFFVVPSPSGWVIFSLFFVFLIWLLRRSLQLSRHSVS